MKLVWKLENATVRDIYEALLQQRKIAYTTVMTMMKILETKGYLKKRCHERAFIYRPEKDNGRLIASCSSVYADRPPFRAAVKTRHASQRICGQYPG